MDPKFFSGGQHGMPMQGQQPNTPNARMMMALQQQQQQQQQQQGDPSLQQQQYNTMPGNALNFGGGPFAQGVFDQNDLAAYMSSQQQLMNHMSPQQNAMLQQQGGFPQQNMMQFAPNRPMFQGNNDVMSQNTPQALLYQRQQQAMAMNRVKQSPSQSPAINNTQFQNASMNAGSPRAGGEYGAASPASVSVSSPAQSVHSAVPGTPMQNRVIPSQTMGRYMQQQQQQPQPPQQQQQSPHVGSPLHLQQQQQHAMMQSANTPHMPAGDNRQTPQQAAENTYNQMMQGQQAGAAASPAPVPRRSATPGSAASTPIQPHVKAETTNRAQPEPESPGKVSERSRSRAPSTSRETPAKAESPSPRPSPAAKRERASSPVSAAMADNNRGGSQPPPGPITYIPKNRMVDTYGGVDLKYFDKFDVKPLMPSYKELGIIDIHALTMSIKSGLKMEMTNALNLLTVVTASFGVLQLAQCDDLLDVLLDCVEEDVFGYCSRYDDVSRPAKRRSTGGAPHTYAELFDMSLDEMKSMIPKLEKSTSDLWLSLRQRCLCIFNIFRNLSFVHENIDYFSKHDRFIKTMARVVSRTWNVDNNKDDDGWFVSIRRMDALDFRKAILTIYSNIAMWLPIRSADMANMFVRLVHDFITSGTETYYASLAVETWAKVAVNYDNRRAFRLYIDKYGFDALVDIWLALCNIICENYHTHEGKLMAITTMHQLTTLEYVVLSMYNIVAILIEHSDERELKERIYQSNPGIFMTLIRLSIMFADSTMTQLLTVSRRALEVVRTFVCGSEQKGDRRRGEADDSNKDDSEGSNQDFSALADRWLDMTTVRELLFMAMLRRTTDANILRVYNDFVTLIDGRQESSSS